MGRRIYPGPPGADGPPGPPGTSEPWNTLQWVNGGSLVASPDGSIGAPQLNIDDAIAAVDDGGSINIGAGTYSIATVGANRTINFYGLGGPQGGSGDNARVMGFAIGAGANVRLDSLSLLDNVDCTAPGGTVYCSNVSFGGKDLNAAGFGVRLFADGLETGNVRNASATLLLSEGMEHDGTITVTDLLTLRDCVCGGASTCGTLAATGSVFDADITATIVAAFVDCYFTAAITVTAPLIQTDALSYTRAVAAGVTFTSTPVLTEGSSGITNESGVAGATVSDALDTLDAGIAGFVPTSRTLTAGTGMTGGGDLSADRTFNVAANADGSIIANADDIQVGVLATDAQHGNRGGGGIHANATTSVAGFMSGADKTKLNNFASLTQGSDLGNSNATIQPNAGTQYTLPASTYTADRTITWGTTGAFPGLIMGVNVYDTSGNQKLCVNGGAGGGNFFDSDAAGLSSTPFTVWAQYDGTNWIYISAGLIA